MLYQALDGNHRAVAGLFPAMTGVFLVGHRMVGRDISEGRPGNGELRVLVGLQREARVAAPFVDRNNRSAIALSRIRRYGLVFERNQADHLDRHLGFAAIVGSHRRRR